MRLRSPGVAMGAERERVAGFGPRPPRHNGRFVRALNNACVYLIREDERIAAG